MDYVLHLAILICIYTILSQSLSIVAGYSGQLSLAHAGFYGIGAYTTALLSVNYGLSTFITFPLAMLFSGIIAFIVSKIAGKTVDDYFIIITLGIQVVMFSIFNNWQEVTQGPLGISAIPSIVILGFPIESKISFLALSLFFMVTIWYVINNFVSSPFGQLLRAISEDEVFTKSLGKNVYQAKIIAFTISGILASIAGFLYAHYISYIDPTSFTITESIFILSIVIIGGMTNLKTIFFATAFFLLLPEILRFIGIPSNIAANMRQIIYGITLILVIFYKYSGTSKEYS
ncbi:MAG: branched-chain amino acid ABC transporter permease [Rivularia sp. ALOHA_DT_140]|nr:branched-chain amino acid ABC transporter permease [Rivularia sp. ALOHA_DT_140]